MVPMLSQSIAAVAGFGFEGRHRMRNRLRVHTTPLSLPPSHALTHPNLELREAKHG
jgi:hypothetical protein